MAIYSISGYQGSILMAAFSLISISMFIFLTFRFYVTVNGCRCSLLTFVICWGVSMLFGCGLIFASGVVYGIMGIGKKYVMQNNALWYCINF